MFLATLCVMPTGAAHSSLIAAVYANPDEVMKDDKYAYDTISFSVLADLGEAFIRHAFTP